MSEAQSAPPSYAASALELGYSPREVADYLAQSKGFDAAGARKAGYNDAQILDFLGRQAKAVPGDKPGLINATAASSEPWMGPVGTERMHETQLTTPTPGVEPAVGSVGGVPVTERQRAAWDRGMESAAFASPITAYHGSPHAFEKFDSSKIGTGEGAQAYGHGLYFAGNEGVAKSYRDTLSSMLSPAETKQYVDANNRRGAAQQAMTDLHWEMVEESKALGASVPAENSGWGDYGITPLPEVRAKYQPKLDELLKKFIDAADEMRALEKAPRSPGAMYEARLNVEPEQLLDWDRPLSEQPQAVREALGSLGMKGIAPTIRETDGGFVVDYVGRDGARTSRAFATREAAQKAAVETEKMMGETGEGAWNRTAGKIGSEYPGATKGYMPPPGFNAQALAAEELNRAGIPGIQYLDGGSRAAGDGTRNYVIFPGNEHLIDIVRRYGVAAFTIPGVAEAWRAYQEAQKQPEAPAKAND